MRVGDAPLPSHTNAYPPPAYLETTRVKLSLDRRDLGLGGPKRRERGLRRFDDLARPLHARLGDAVSYARVLRNDVLVVRDLLDEGVLRGACTCEAT